MIMPITKEAHSIANAWEKFRKRFIAADVPAADVERMRLVFYSGAWSFGAVPMLVAEDQMDGEKGARMTAAMIMELVDFYHELGIDPR